VDNIAVRNLVPLVLVKGSAQFRRSPSEFGGSDFGTKSLPGSDIWSRPDARRDWEKTFAIRALTAGDHRVSLALA
jgi:hypothetical protein